MNSYLLFKHKLQKAVGDEVKANNEFRAERRHMTSKESYYDDRDYRNIVKSGKNANDLPEAIRSELQQRRHHKRKERNGDARPLRDSHDLCIPNSLAVIQPLFKRHIHIETEKRRRAIEQRVKRTKHSAQQHRQEKAARINGQHVTNQGRIGEVYRCEFGPIEVVGNNARQHHQKRDKHLEESRKKHALLAFG